MTSAQVVVVVVLIPFAADAESSLQFLLSADLVLPDLRPDEVLPPRLVVMLMSVTGTGTHFSFLSVNE
jgi:hypothetical protein